MPRFLVFARRAARSRSSVRLRLIRPDALEGFPLIEEVPYLKLARVPEGGGACFRAERAAANAGERSKLCPGRLSAHDLVCEVVATMFSPAIYEDGLVVALAIIMR